MRLTQIVHSIVHRVTLANYLGIKLGLYYGVQEASLERFNASTQSICIIIRLGMKNIEVPHFTTFNQVTKTYICSPIHFRAMTCIHWCPLIWGKVTKYSCQKGNGFQFVVFKSVLEIEVRGNYLENYGK